MKVFIDTAPFIYLIEGNTKFIGRTKKYFSERFVDKDEIITSIITLSEYGIKPVRENRTNLIDEFHDFLKSARIPLYSINELHAKIAYELRAKYTFLKGMDALQIAVAIEQGCSQFFTNDLRLEKITEIEIILIEKV